MELLDTSIININNNIPGLLAKTMIILPLTISSLIPKMNPSKPEKLFLKLYKIPHLVSILNFPTLRG